MSEATVERKEDETLDDFWIRVQELAKESQPPLTYFDFEEENIE